MAKRWKYTTGLCLLGLGVAGCVKDPAPFDPRRSQATERSLAREMESRPMPTLPTTLQSEYAPPVRNPDGTIRRAAPTTTPVTGPIIRPDEVRRLTLQEVIQRAVINNRDVRVAGFDPAIEQTRIIEAEARFDPTLFAAFQHAQADNETAGITVPNPRNPLQNLVARTDELRQTQYQGGVRQNLGSGGQIELRQQFTYTYQDPARTVTNPYYESQLVLEVTQPLLRDFGNDVNQARINIARNTTRVSVLEFRRQLEETLFTLERTYWQQAQAAREVEVLERLLQRTENTADILIKRYGERVSREQTSDAAASVEARRATLVRARARVLELSYQLKRLMNDPELPVTSPTVLLPASAPITDPLRFTLAEQVDAAMEHRFDLAQQLLRIEAAGIVARVARNNLLPSLNLTGALGSQGIDAQGQEAWYDQNSGDNLNYRVGFQFEVPIGNRAAKAIMRRSQLQRQQAIEAYEGLVTQASQEVSQAYLDVQTSWDLMRAARQSRFAADDALGAIQDRELADPNAYTAEFVNRKLQAQADLATQELAEIEATANYQTAIAQLERAKGTLLKYNNVLMKEESLPFAYRPIPHEPKLPPSKSLHSALE